MSFKKFDVPPKGQYRPEAKFVSMSKGGKVFFISKSLHHHFHGVDYITVWWDEEKRLIGIKPVKESGIRLRVQCNSGMMFSARGFGEHIGMKDLTVTRFPAEWKNGMLVAKVMEVK